jgi:hypothetical protein
VLSFPTTRGRPSAPAIQQPPAAAQTAPRQQPPRAPQAPPAQGTPETPEMEIPTFIRRQMD